MDIFTMQDWATIRGASGQTVKQDEAQWLDLWPYQDVFFWLDVAEASGSALLAFQTAPTKDDSFFQTMLTPVTMTATTAPTIWSAPALAASVPVARFVRWQMTGTGAFDATFRVVVAAITPGLCG